MKKMNALREVRIEAKGTRIVCWEPKDPAFFKIAQDDFIYTVDYQSSEKVKAFVLRFDKEFGPRLAEMNK